MNHIDAAAMFNRIRATLTTEDQHVRLDDEVTTYAAHMDDNEQANDFMARVVVGSLPPDQANIRDVIMSAFDVAPSLSYASLVEWVMDAITDATERHLGLAVGDIVRMLVSENVIRRTSHGFYVRTGA